MFILASKRYGTLYIGVTNDLETRVYQHKTKTNSSFTATYGVDKLMYREEYQYVDDAIKREKRLKKYKREWKVNLIEQDNPEWKDLAADWYD